MVDAYMVEKTVFSEFPKRLCYARVMNGYTKQGLSKQMGLSPYAVYRWEEGRNLPSAPILALIAITLGVPIDWLLGLKEVPAINDAELMQREKRRFANENDV